MKITRRHFLQHGLRLGACAGWFGAGLSRLEAQTLDDYKALVCIFLYGGNDGNNTIIAHDSAGYAAYEAVRGAASGVQIARSELLPIEPRGSAQTFGLHPALKKLHPLFASGRLAILANVGPLNRPMTKADYQAGRDLPYQLFSHSDQQAQWQSANSFDLTPYGWGGRLADATQGFNGSSAVPVMISLAGSHKFTKGERSKVLSLAATGSFQLGAISGNSTLDKARAEALTALLAEASDHALITEAAQGLAQAIDLSQLVNPILSRSQPEVSSAFSGVNSTLGNQLQRAANLIAARSTLGVKRQIFFVSLGGFDTHGNQLATQNNLLTQLDAAWRAFYDATVNLGVADRVTSFTLSDFGRTFKAAAGGGTDHAWGNHHFILGDAVQGGKLYGTWPQTVLGGPDDVGQEGRWLPTTSVDQYAATLARWFGVGEAELTQVLPNLGAFPQRTLGFV